MRRLLPLLLLLASWQPSHAAPWLHFEANKTYPGSGAATRVEFRRLLATGLPDPAWSASLPTAGMPTRTRRMTVAGQSALTTWYQGALDLAGTKDARLEARTCNAGGCGAWKGEPRLSCGCWAGKAGCATAVLMTTPSTGACPAGLTNADLDRLRDTVGRVIEELRRERP